MKIIGVDVGSYSIKIAEIDAGTRSFVLTNFFEKTLSTDPSRDRAIEIIEVLRDFSKNYDSKTTRYVVGIPLHRVSVRQNSFPFRERAKIMRSLPFELEDEIPLNIDETIFDYKTIEFTGPLAEVLTVAAPFESVEEALQLSKDGGFDPQIVSVEGFALANLYENWMQAPPEVPPSVRISEETGFGTPLSRPASLVLHMGHSRSLLLVYRGTRLVAVRSLQWGGTDIANSLGAAFSLSSFEAIRFMKEQSFILMNSAGANRDQVKLSGAITSVVDDLIRDLRLTLVELKSSLNIDFTQIELEGGISQIQNIGPYLTQGLEIPANVTSQAVMNQPNRISMTPQIAAVAGVAIGLAIEAMKRPRNPAINLRRGDFARENASLKEFIERWKVPAQVMASAFALFFIFAVVRDQLATTLFEASESKLSEATSIAAGLKGAAATESAARAFISKSKNRLRNQESINDLDNYVPAIDVLAKISEKFPPKGQPGIDVTTFNIDNEDVTIQGHAATRDLVTSVEKAVNEIAKPKTVKPGPPGDNRSGVAFSYTFKMSRKQ